MKLHYAKDIKYYTWTDENINNELEKIKSFENRNMQIIYIPTYPVAVTTPENLGWYNTISKYCICTLHGDRTSCH